MQNMEQQATQLNLLSAGRTLIADKAAPLSITTDEEPVIFVCNYASVIHKQTYAVSGLLGHLFHFGEQVRFSNGKPQLAKFKAQNDAVIIALKLSSGVPYLYGITVPNLIKFNEEPPSPTAIIDEAKWLQSWRANLADLESLTPLVDSETHKFNMMVDKFVSHMQLFKGVGIRNLKQMEKHAEKGFEKNVKAVVLEMEKQERKGGAEKGRAARDMAESAAVGAWFLLSNLSLPW